MEILFKGNPRGDYLRDTTLTFVIVVFRLNRDGAEVFASCSFGVLSWLCKNFKHYNEHF